MSVRSHSSYRQPSKKGSSHGTSSYDESFDLENDNRDKYRRIIKKLSDDKIKLKDKLRRLIDEIEQRTEEHHRELGKTQDYFQEQISDLTEERDNAHNQLGRLRLENEQLQDRFSDCEKSKNKKSLETNLLKEAVSTLQKRLNEQIEEGDMVKDTAEKMIAKREEQLKTNIVDLEEQLRKTREAHAADRHRIQQLSSNFATEKDALARQLAIQHKEKTDSLIAEKTAIINTLQSSVDRMEKRSKEIEKERERIISDTNFRIENAKAEFDRGIENILKTNDAKTIKMRENYEGQLVQLDKNSKNALEQQRLKHERELEIANNRAEKKYAQLMSDKKIEATTSQNELEKLKKEYEALKNSLEKQIQIRTSEIKTYYDKIIMKLRNEMEAKLEKKRDEYSALQTRDDRIQEEMRNSNNILKAQIEHTVEENKRLKLNSEQLSTQYIKTLNEQKMEMNKAIGERDSKIADITRQMRNLGEETVVRFNLLEEKIQTSEQRKKEAENRYNQAKLDLETSQSNCEIFKKEIFRFKELCDKLQIKIKFLDEQINTERIKCSKHEEEVKQLEKILSDCKQNTARMFHSENKMHAKHSEEIQQLRSDLNEKTKTLATLNEVHNQKMERLQKNISTLERDKITLKGELDAKGIENAQLKKVLDQANAQIAENQSRLNQVKKQLERY